MTGIYQPPTPPIGPDRSANASPLTDRVEVEAARDAMRAFDRFLLDCAEDCINGPEQFSSHEEYVAAAHEIWGDDL